MLALYVHTMLILESSTEARLDLENYSHNLYCGFWIYIHIRNLVEEMLTN